jgi:FkbM family methyltransferase
VDQRLVRLAERLGVADYARPVKRALERPQAKRLRRDHDHLQLLLTFVLGEADNCVDVGASRGAVLEEMVRLAPSGRHVAFEPIPHLHRALAERFPQVDVRHAAASAETGEAEFMLDLVRDDMSGLRQLAADHGVERIKVRTEALDEVLPDDYVPRLVKIDVEGGELDVLRGAERTIRTHRPIVVFELTWAAYHYGTGAQEIHEFLSGAGLRIFDLLGAGPYTRGELGAAFERGFPENFVAH